MSLVCKTREVHSDGAALLFRRKELNCLEVVPGQEVRRNLGKGYNLYGTYTVQDIKVGRINKHF